VRLGLLGGTFDPPHVGHLLAAVDALEALALDRLVLVPSGQQPLKVGEVAATPAQRLAMARLLVGEQPRLAVDPIEIERGGLSYSVDTLSAYAERHPAAERFFLVGADVLTTFDKWREPERVLRLARLVVLRRAVDGGGRVAVPRAPAGAEPIELPTRRVDVSSTEVRARVRAGKSVRGFVPDAVAAYIASEGLYRG
jgi:nicotinate-nucleotide adenylyltransferase